MQLISAFPTLAIKTPSNVDSVHQSFDEIVNFEVVSKENLYDWLLVPLFDLTNSEDLFLEDVDFDEGEDVKFLGN